MNVEKAVRDLLVADGTVTAGLNTYAFTTGSETPAVFTGPKLPDDAKYPAVLIMQISGTPWGTRDSRGGEIFADVDLWGDKDQSLATLRATAEDIQQALDRATLSVSGYDCVLCQADPEIRTDDDDGFPGYRIAIRVLLIESES